MGSRCGSILVHTKDVFNLWQYGVVKHLQIGLAYDVPVKKVWPNKVAPHYSEPYNKLFFRRGFVVNSLQVDHHVVHINIASSPVIIWVISAWGFPSSNELAVLDSSFRISFAQLMPYLHIYILHGCHLRSILVIRSKWSLADVWTGVSAGSYIWIIL